MFPAKRFVKKIPSDGVDAGKAKMRSVFSINRGRPSSDGTRNDLRSTCILEGSTCTGQYQVLCNV